MKILRNVNVKRTPMSTWRKIAIGTWNPPGDPSMYGKITIRTEGLERAVSLYRSRGIKMSALTLLAHAVSRAIVKYPQVNSLVRLGRIYQREEVNVCIAATLNDDEELTGILIRNCDQLSPEEIGEELSSKVDRVRSGEDVEFEQVKKSTDKIPGIVMNPFMKLISFILYSLNIWLPSLGLEKDSLGSVQITTLGKYGVEEGYGPLDPYSRVPMMVMMGGTRNVPVVQEGVVGVGREASICFTFDHRIVDGVIAAKIMNEVQRRLEDELELAYYLRTQMPEEAMVRNLGQVR